MNSKGSASKILLALIIIAVLGAGSWYFLSKQTEKAGPAQPAQVQGTPLRVENVNHHSLAFKLAYYESSELCEYLKVVILKGADELVLNERCGREPAQRLNLMFQSKYSNLIKLGPKDEDLFILLLDEPTKGNYRTTLVNAVGDLKLGATINAMGQFRDYNGDGYLDFLVDGESAEIEGLAPSYDPYLVYVQSKSSKGISFQIDEKLSEKYSAENNYPWQGPNRILPEPEIPQELESEEELEEGPEEETQQ